MNKILVAIIVGSDSDLKVMSEAAKILEGFNIPFEITISSAHRSPKLAIEKVSKYYKTGVKVIIAGAGLAAHLAGTVAAHFPLPVIGVPLKNGTLSGVDSLFSTVQMPPGIPVAAVGINNAKNAGLLAIQILATSDEKLEDELLEYKKSLSEGVLKKAEKLKDMGYKKYIETQNK